MLGRPRAARIVEGDIVGEILRAAKDGDADMIIMATEGRTGLRRALFGSLTEAVVRLSPVPVLSLRGTARVARSVLAPVNAQSYSMAGFHYAEDVARVLGASITMLHVKEKGWLASAPLRRIELAADAARTFLRLDVALKVVDGDPVRKIVEESSKHDLVVLVAHRKGLLRDGILGTTAEQVLRRCDAPVLSVPAPVLTTPPGSRRRSPGLRGRRAARSVFRRLASTRGRSRSRGASNAAR